MLAMARNMMDCAFSGELMKIVPGHLDWVQWIGSDRHQVPKDSHNSRSALCMVCGIVVVSVFISTSHASAAEELAEQIKLGRTLYSENCASCHGAKLEGQPDWRKRKANGRMPAPPHDATGHTWHHRDDQLFKITKFGTEAIVGDFYKSDMIGFADVLTDVEIHAVLAFIKSTWPKRIRKRVDRINRRQAQ
jgi:mono/diheme cytochrome c family protein